ncbi:MAG TPA: hypothetical protein VES02_09950 [Dermatophilaceae bacterium]|nr:hypothetical protein [Dermatophilaceae bacterium]
MTIFRRLRRKPVGRHAHRGSSVALTIVPGAPSPLTPAVAPRAGAAPLVPHAIRRTTQLLPVPLVVPPPSTPPPADPADVAPPEQDQAEGTRVGLFFGDGSHVVIDASDPRAGAFASIAEELNH